jgi:5-methylthioadenosine/S-adenosylhomocysteine deaminase
MKKQFSVLIRAGFFIPMSEDFHTRKKGQPLKVLKDWAIGIEANKITYLSEWNEIEPKIENQSVSTTEFIDASNKIVMPGLINGHSHLPMTLFRGLADDLPFEEWLHKYILPLEGRLVSPEFVTLGTELACLESMLSGITTTHDMYFFEDVIADTIVKAGLRGVIGESISDFTPPDDKNKKGLDFEIAQNLCDKYKNHNHLHSIISPHAPYSCSDETLKKVLKFSEKNNVAIGMHISETQFEVENSLKQYGMTPLKRIERLGLLERPFLAAHCVHLTDDEIHLAAQKKMSVIYNPESNMKLGAGAARIPKMLEAGVVVGIGTDGTASNNNLNLFGEMDTGAKLQKMVSGLNTALTASDVLWMATKAGAEALKIGHLTGSIEIGKRADIICIDTKVPHMQPMHDPVAQIVYSAQGYEVDTVIVEGKKLVDNKKCLTLDAQSLSQRIDHYRIKNKF